MDTTTIIILTALINFFVTGLVGGIVVYRFQKRIDNLYAQQMEEFKAGLQKASFEQQTKYVRNHEKMVETLETIYQRYSVFESSMTNILYGGVDIISRDNKTFTIVEEEFIAVTDKFEELDKFFLNNKIYLPKTTSDLISRAFINTRLITMIVPMIVILIGDKKNIPQAIRFINSTLMASEMDAEKINPKNIDVRKLIDRICSELKKYNNLIEDYYRDASGTK